MKFAQQVPRSDKKATKNKKVCKYIKSFPNRIQNPCFPTALIYNHKYLSILLVIYLNFCMNWVLKKRFYVMKFVWQNLAAVIKFDHLNLLNICICMTMSFIRTKSHTVVLPSSRLYEQGEDPNCLGIRTTEGNLYFRTVHVVIFILFKPTHALF